MGGGGSKHAGSESEAFWLRPGMAIGPDGTYRNRLPASDSVPFFQRRPGSSCGKPARVRSGWPGQVWAKRIWSGSKPGCKNHEARFWQSATGPQPVSHLQTRLRCPTGGPNPTVQNRPGSDRVLADCVRFWPDGFGPEASRCARLIGPVSGQCFPANPDRMRIGSGMFAGDPVHSTVRVLVLYAPQCECSFRTLHSASARFVRARFVHSTMRVLVSYAPQRIRVHAPVHFQKKKKKKKREREEDAQWDTVDAEFKVTSVVNPELTNVLLF